MTLSRTARILIALLLVAAASFLWINLFATTPDASPVLTRSTPSGPVEAGVPPAVDDGDDGAGDETEGADDANLPFIAPGDAEPQERDAAGPDTDPNGAGADGPPTVVAPSETDVVGRDVVVAEFPFLITAPPLTGDATAGEEADVVGAGRPGSAARASMNPFSPIIVQAATVPVTEEADPPPASPEVVEVDVPDAPSSPAQPRGETARAAAPDAPAPRALAPSSPRSAALPRPLPSGTLPVAPDLLSGTRAEAASRTSANMPRVAVREPSEDAEASPSLRPVGGTLATGDREPTPMAPGEVAAAGIPDRPLVAGSDALSRYLRDQNVTFTGSVVGSVGVGVFRVADTTTPIVLALGQPLPDSDIVLTDLRGQAAEFTLNDTSQVLNLDLRR